MGRASPKIIDRARALCVTLTAVIFTESRVATTIAGQTAFPTPPAPPPPADALRRRARPGLKPARYDEESDGDAPGGHAADGQAVLDRRRGVGHFLLLKSARVQAPERRRLLVPAHLRLGLPLLRVRDSEHQDVHVELGLQVLRPRHTQRERRRGAIHQPPAASRRPSSEARPSNPTGTTLPRHHRATTAATAAPTASPLPLARSSSA